MVSATNGTIEAARRLADRYGMELFERKIRGSEYGVWITTCRERYFGTEMERLAWLEGYDDATRRLTPGQEM